jgi:hypothetical protein
VLISQSTDSVGFSEEVIASVCPSTKFPISIVYIPK